MVKICKFNTPLILGIALLAFGLAGCASNPQRKAFAEEKELVAAGFKFKVAESPEVLERMSKLPQYELIPYIHEGKKYYIYPNVKGCNCVYAGDESAHRQLRKRLREQKLAGGLWPGRMRRLWIDTDDGAYMKGLDAGMLPAFESVGQ